MAAKLSADARKLFEHLMDGREGVRGLFALTPEVYDELHAELGWGFIRVDEGFAELKEKGFAAPAELYYLFDPTKAGER